MSIVSHTGGWVGSETNTGWFRGLWKWPSRFQLIHKLTGLSLPRENHTANKISKIIQILSLMDVPNKVKSGTTLDDVIEKEISPLGWRHSYIDTLLAPAVANTSWSLLCWLNCTANKFFPWSSCEQNEIIKMHIGSALKHKNTGNLALGYFYPLCIMLVLGYLDIC